MNTKLRLSKILSALVIISNADFTVLLTGSWESSFVKFPYVVSDELTGEIVNDAIYMRNVMICEKYGVNIKEVDMTGQDSMGNGTGYKTISKSVMAGEINYDAAYIGTYDVCSLARDGYLYNLLLDVPYIDVEKPWWDSCTKKDMMINNKIFFTNGDINILNNETTFAILFNKKLLQEYSLESPYALVKGGNWTLDKFIEMTKATSKDLNGDGEMDENDQYGHLMWQDSILGVIIGSGEKVATVINGNIELTFYNENTDTVASKYLEHAKDKMAVYNISTNTKRDAVEMFANDQGLFHTRYITTVSLLRNMETDFGILPYPKQNESQKDYFTYVHGYGNSFVCVPKTAGNVEMSGVILEAMAAESMYSVTPAYYDVTLTGKFFRDEESREMLDILFASRTFDAGLYYRVGGYTDTLLQMLNNLKADFASTYEKSESKAREEIEKINQAFKENN